MIDNVNMYGWNNRLIYIAQYAGDITWKLQFQFELDYNVHIEMYHE
jgi:hypothetical protein